MSPQIRCQPNLQQSRLHLLRCPALERSGGGEAQLEPERLDVSLAAERQGCSTQAIRRRIRNDILPAVKERTLGRGGRHVVKYMIEIRDLEVAMSSRQAIQEKHKRRIREATVSAPRFTEEQRARIAATLRHAEIWE